MKEEEKTAVMQRWKNGQGIGNVTKACRTWRTSLGKMRIKRV